MAKAHCIHIKKEFLAQIRAGTKTIEIRVGHRYQNIRAGDTLLWNYRRPGNVVRVVETFSSLEDLFRALEGRWDSVSSRPAGDMKQAMRALYPQSTGPYFAMTLEPEPE